MSYSLVNCAISDKLAKYLGITLSVFVFKDRAAATLVRAMPCHEA